MRRRSSSEMTNPENAVVRRITSLNAQSNSSDVLSQIVVDEELAKLFNNNSIHTTTLPSNNENFTISLDRRLMSSSVANHTKRPSLPNEKMENLKSLPDQAVILERLVRIRQYKQQVLDTLDKLKENGEEVDRNLLSKLIKAYDSFKEQEDQYLLILQKVLALKHQFTLRLAAQSSSQSELSDISDHTPLPSFSANLAAEVVQNVQNQRVVPYNNTLSKSLHNHQLASAHMKQNSNRQRRSSDFELKAYPQVGGQFPSESSLMSKSRELDALKEKLETLKKLCDVTSDELVRNPNDVEGQKAVKNKLLILNENKKRVDELLNCIDNVGEVISNTDELFSCNSSAAENSRRSNNFGSAFVKSASSTANDMPAPNSRTLMKSSSPSVEPKRSQKTQQSDSEHNSVAYQQKYSELTATKNRLAKLQHLVGQLQDNVDSNVSTTKSKNSQVALGKNSDSYVENGDSENEVANMAALSFRMRSAYESKLNEQQQAVQNLQEEHERLMTIKNQLMTLSNAQVHPNVSQSGGSKSLERATREDVSAVRGNDEVWRDLRHAHSIQQQVQGSPSSNTVAQSRSRTTSTGQIPQPRSRTTSTGQHLNNFTEIGLGNSPILSRLKPRVNENLPTDFGSQGQQKDVAHDDSRYPPTSTIANNPRLPSFRRNNQLDDNNVSHSDLPPRRHGRSVKRDDVPLPSTPRRMSLDSCSQYENRRRDSQDHYANANLEQQYQQLQQHIDSIRSIFQQLMKDQSVGPTPINMQQQFFSQNLPQQQQQQNMINSMNSSQQPLIDAAAKLLAQQQNPWDHLYSSLNPSSLAVQQQQLMVSLFSCQQQLQLQQMEMRYLQQLCQDLLSTRHSTTAENNAVADFQSTRSRSASLVHSTAPPPIPLGSHQPGAVNLPMLDGRPLSTASLYNLLAPNPYLTFPYYPAQQQYQPVYQNGTMSAANEQQPQQKFTHNGNYRNTGQPYTSTNAKYQKHNQNRHALAMSQSLIEHGSERIFHDGESNVNANVMSMSDTLKSTTTKLADLDNNSMYNSKSNVSKKQINYDNQGGYSDTRQQSFGNSFTPDGSLIGDQFDTLREMIYSEVATLISQNEQRPQFLLELFRELQLLTSEHLRMRALQAIRNVLNRYLFNEGHINESDHNHERSVNNSRNVVEETQTESTGTSDDENSKQTRRFREPSSLAKLQENVMSPSDEVTVDEIILLSDSRKDTESAKPTKRAENAENKNVKEPNDKIAQSSVQNVQKFEVIPTVSPSTGDIAVNSKVVTDKSNVDVGGLEQQIQSVVDELIPFLKENVDSVCNPQLLQYLRKMVISLAISKCLPEGSANTFFQRQLSSILDDTLAKFQGQNLQDCGEEMLGDVSEVVFNELAFFRLMQNIDSVDNEPRKSDADESEDNLGPETTEPEDDEEEDSDKPSSPEAIAAASHQDISEKSEDVDVSAITAISTSRVAVRMDVANNSVAENKTTLSGDRTSTDNEKNRRQSNDSGKAVEVVLTTPLTVQVTSATDEDENSISSESTSMHTADIHPYVEKVVQKDDYMKQISGDSKESTPPDELLLDIEEVPENIDNADQTPTIPGEREITTFDLDFEPHPEDKLQLTIDSVEFRNLQNQLMVPDEVEEEDDEQQTNSLETGANLNSFSDNTQACTGD